MLDVSFDQALTYINCRFNQITDFRTIACNSLPHGSLPVEFLS